MLLYDIGKAGYDVRYKIQDLSQFGLVQKRKRLLIIAARFVVCDPHANDKHTDMSQTGYTSTSLPKAHAWRFRKWSKPLRVHRRCPHAHYPPRQASYERPLPSTEVVSHPQTSL